jgi:alkyl hydroperoxide reductase subunit AhpC
MSIRINDIAPDFTAETTQGPISFHDWIGDGWAVLFSHPKNFTPVCTTELGTMAGLEGEFKKRNVKIIGISVDPVQSHEKWQNDIKTATGHSVNYPLIGDKDLKVAKLYEMLPAGAGETSEAVRRPTTHGPFGHVIGRTKDQAGSHLSDDDRPQLR